MKHTLIFAALGLVASGVAAQEIGRVISSTPVIQQTAVPRQVCNNQPVMVQHQPSGVGGVLGAIAGAAIGSQIGGGSGRGVATVLGTVGGAIVGNNMEGGGQYVQNVPQCSTQTSYENRTVAWNVTYEYAGRQYSVQMPYDPGPTIRLQVSPMSSSDYQQPDIAQGGIDGGPVVVAPAIGSQGYAGQGYATAQPPVVVPAPAPIAYASYPAYPAYAAYPAYPAYAPAYRPYAPIGISLGFGFSSGHRHHHRRGHRH